jgi:transposase
MRFVQVKSAEQQGRLMLHRTRDLLMRQRTQVINALRAHLAELGIVAAQGNAGLKELLTIIASEEDARLPVEAHASLIVLAMQLHAAQTTIGSIEKRIMAQYRASEGSHRSLQRTAARKKLCGDMPLARLGIPGCCTRDGWPVCRDR